MGGRGASEVISLLSIRLAIVSLLLPLCIWGTYTHTHTHARIHSTRFLPSVFPSSPCVFWFGALVFGSYRLVDGLPCPDPMCFCFFWKKPHPVNTRHSRDTQVQLSNSLFTSARTTTSMGFVISWRHWHRRLPGRSDINTRVDRKIKLW